MNFSERTDALSAALGGASIVALGKFIGMSHESLSGYRTGRIKISSKAWRKLEVAEVRAGVRNNQISAPESEGVHEVSAPYFPRNTVKEEGRINNSPVQLNPAFAPPGPHPTPQDCINHLAAYLAEAKYVPGLVAHTLIELKKNFKITEARAQREDL